MRRLAAASLVDSGVRFGLQKQAEAAQRWLVKSRAERRVCERGGERGDTWWNAHANANAKCACEMRNAQQAACVVWAACVVVRARAKAPSGMRTQNAEARTCQAACKASGMQMRRGHDGKWWKHAR